MYTTQTSKETLNEKSIETSSLYNISTGGDDRANYLYSKLKYHFVTAKKIDIIVSFLMESGVKLLLNDLKEAINRGVKIRILTGNYLNITQPSALYLLKNEFKNNIEIKFYNNKNKSFHPKSYIFHDSNDSTIFIGSSNISRGALTDSIEWNYSFKKSSNIDDFNYFFNTFEDLYNHHSIEVNDDVLANYSKTWIKPKLYKDLENTNKETEIPITNLYEPRGPQIEILYSLEQTREDGFDKGLVIAATGVGKTYLSAFDSLKYERVLFIAHREEIIKQAMQSFKNVRPNKTAGFFYSNIKETDKDLTFALVQTLGKSEYLNEDFFPSNYFDYIVIDEFHHASSNNYKKIIDYFKPKFLLGLTATPERLDGKDVFAICDYNTVYEVRLKEAINRGSLVPFKYYGIYDKTVKYENIEFINGKYNSNQLEEALSIPQRDDLIIKHFNKYKSNAAIGFCSSRKHAEHMAKAFTKAGIKSLAVYSGENGEYSENRTTALDKLRKGEIKVLFSVDMFNEGLDVPMIDLVLFLRPTESPTIFLQQLGRGLRKYKNKECLIVLDFIGNYKNANLAPFLLAGKPYDKTKSKNFNPTEYEYPVDCYVDFDFEIIDLFKKISESQFKLKDLILEEFLRIYNYYGRIPTRVELFHDFDYQLYLNMKSNSKENIFKDYFSFLNKNNLLVNESKNLFNSLAYTFINMIETTAMSKSYKLPIFLAFYNNGNIKEEITTTDIYLSFKEFYSKPSNKVDMLKDKGTKNFETWEEKEFVNLAKKTAIHFLCKTENQFFEINEKENMILKGLSEFIKDETFIKNFKDAVDFRTEQYYEDRFNRK